MSDTFVGYICWIYLLDIFVEYIFYIFVGYICWIYLGGILHHWRNVGYICRRILPTGLRMSRCDLKKREKYFKWAFMGKKMLIKVMFDNRDLDIDSLLSKKRKFFARQRVRSSAAAAAAAAAAKSSLLLRNLPNIALANGEKLKLFHWSRNVGIRSRLLTRSPGQHNIDRLQFCINYSLLFLSHCHWER